jgi:riboflavin synthase
MQPRGALSNGSIPILNTDRPQTDRAAKINTMFTGLVEGIGRLMTLQVQKNLTRLMIDLGSMAEGVKPGDSIAVNGCCLTVSYILGTHCGFDLLQETLTQTNLGQIRPKAAINVERAMPAQGRFGGHFVTGHIDGVGVIRRWEQVGRDHELRIAVDPFYAAYLVPKGCIAVDGISLTVAEVGQDEFSVWIIPHTRTSTAMRERRLGDWVNLEFDLLAKYTEKILAVREKIAGDDQPVV